MFLILTDKKIFLKSYKNKNHVKNIFYKIKKNDKELCNYISETYFKLPESKF